jgi:hypothetical protein
MDTMTAHHLNAEYAAIMGKMNAAAFSAAAAIDAIEAELDGDMALAEQIRKDAAEALALEGIA